MNFISTAALALAMSTDAFAAAIGKGTALHKPRWSEALRTGAIFGIIEALTPLLGWALGLAAVGFVKAWDHWIAFTLLGALGLHMIWNGLKTDEDEEAAGADAESGKPTRHAFVGLALTGLATSIDAMAVGVGLAFVDVNIVAVAACIGLATFTMVTLGVMLGRVLGAVVGKRAEIAGGVVLIVVGAAILFEHLSGAA
jgi:putative Mn2+ efflux pump MntP